MAVATARTIQRFGRTYSEFDPDGAAGGPSTWILAAPGDGGSSSNSGNASGSFRPADASTIARAGSAVYFTGPGIVDLAVAQDSKIEGGTHPYQVAGFIGVEATNGQLVAVATDGLVSLQDWTYITGSPYLKTNERYFLSDLNPGQLLASCPTTPGSTVVCVGQAISQQTLDIEINLMVHL